MEPNHENQEAETPTKINRKAPRKLHDFEDHSAANPSSKARKIKGTMLAINKPSYCLKKGIGSLQCGGESLRFQHRKRLSRLLNQLIRRHNWAEASGVLSVLLQGTVRDHSLSSNRAKYSVSVYYRTACYLFAFNSQITSSSLICDSFFIVPPLL